MLGQNKTGLVAKDFAGKYQEALILGNFKEEIQKSKKEVEYKTYSFDVEIKGKPFNLSRLMRNQLNHLVDIYGEDESKWSGRKIFIDAEKKGDFFNFTLFGTSKIEHEDVQ